LKARKASLPRVHWSKEASSYSSNRGLPDTLPNPPEDQRQEQDRHPLADDYSRQGTIVIHWSRPHRGLEAVISPD
jgi:hypothetical protein